jgi:hypothetical protein
MIIGMSCCVARADEMSDVLVGRRVGEGETETITSDDDDDDGKFEWK